MILTKVFWLLCASRSSDKNLLRTDENLIEYKIVTLQQVTIGYRACDNTPMTSPYRSATFFMLLALGLLWR